MKVLNVVLNTEIVIRAENFVLDIFFEKSSKTLKIIKSTEIINYGFINNVNLPNNETILWSVAKPATRRIYSLWAKFCGGCNTGNR